MLQMSHEAQKQKLVRYEKYIATLFKAGKIHCPVHLSSGNEAQLISIFGNIADTDYVFSTHRNHLHYILHTGRLDLLTKQVLYNNDSMHTCDPAHNFYSSSIVAGCVAIACGVALAMKWKQSNQKVWVFVGDGATDEGWFIEAVRYAYTNKLPIRYIVEDNNRSVCSDKKQRWGGNNYLKELCQAYKPIICYYTYECKYPHVGIGQFVNLEGDK